MEEFSFRNLVWLTYELGATIAFGIPLVLSIWSILKKESSIMRLLAIYWKVSSLMIISMLLLVGGRQIGYLTSFISPIFIVSCIWIWVDINDELADMPTKRAIGFTVRLWRWSLTLFGILYASLAFRSLSCMELIQGKYCLIWKEAPTSIHNASSIIFKFLFGASWNESLSAFIGYLALLIYIVGLLQWILIRLPRQGRIAGGF